MIFNPNNWFHAFFIIPILNVLMGFYTSLSYLHIPYPMGFSLILLTVAIRLLLNPLTVSQIKSSQKLTKLKPELDKLNEIYKNDKTRLHQEQLKLYQKAGINPAAGCLPLLLQMPILIALYNLFFQILTNGNMNKVVAEVNRVVYFPFLKIHSFDLSFFFLNLSSKPSDWKSGGWWLLLVPIITAGLQYWQTKMMVPQTKIQNPKSKIQKIEKEPVNGKKAVDKSADKEDMGQAMQKQMAIMMPLMIGFFAYSFPLGLSLYWNTFTIFGIIQQYRIAKLDGANEQNKRT
ncbi:hypothetical protein A3D78_01710 [Candidatus Gottesmanbacteria bacterium RIFCSPHIGHO2_02_FULL_39_14]|uniref:Membrane insertase YidC/Oxa/ALB C-terminal domain-containing protein n=3 Tax=Candidatus Gottesmaniibacteriota TaxID=1752720 RepID=A0A1F5ZYY2_9BACT|nr:MAG: hypothetical protein A2153_04285 [Candidatus Gottesmanbacteria bacterium RBG_16_38_7b]OGG17555.1 MAG: hypothetical protein A3D78_01710 [Candidatus Gottesmanbacteria bacterium RIFCSPHIGHO2_02_FULL_39_14]OGG32698.1 MAG: hypothetical protein A3I51_01715 [Candidatus Gottesmanbacteria bacterium RIFCSPLOWO2_02_FULL_38_8]